MIGRRRVSRNVRPHDPWRLLRYALLIFLLAGLLAAGIVIRREAQTSAFQARNLARLGRQMTFAVEPGVSDSIRMPGDGPYDQRLGYSALPRLMERLPALGYPITAQTRISAEMAEVADRSLFLPYREKTQAGLSVLDCANQAVVSARYPERVYPDFDAVPSLVTNSLLFIENRELLSNQYKTTNPAVEWGRFARAAFDQVLQQFTPGHDAAGGSTLATQIEKYRHSPGGRTTSGTDKLRQIASASLRAYLDGEDTTATRRQLVLGYLNTVPLAARRGYGEVIGIGDGLWAWYGRDFDEINAVLRDASAPLEQRALAYKQALSLLISQRRPSGYLSGQTAALEKLTDSYLRLLATESVVSTELRDAALAVHLVQAPGIPEVPRSSFVSRKAASAARTTLAGLLDIRNLYALDRLDLTASSTIDLALQERVAAALQAISSPRGAAAAGLLEQRLLAKSDPSKVIYSFSLFERTPDANLVRVQTDNYEQPLDINEGVRLDLGSTAKLRTLVGYLEIVAALHGQLNALDEAELQARPVAAKDQITRWAVDYLLAARGEERTLAAMLEAALDRRYSASTAESFFTGGGLQTFENFDPADNSRIISVREGFQRSVNLLFIRLMRDIMYHTMFNMAGSSATLLTDPGDEKRRDFLGRFADHEGREYLGRFYKKYRGRSPDEATALLLQGVKPAPRRLAVIFRTLEPAADQADFAKFLRANLPDAKIDDASIAKLYDNYAIDRYDLADRGYIAGVHPLELWLVAWLRVEPDASLSQVLDASTAERQGAYAWLFKTRSKRAQDSRIRTLLEMEAFSEIHKSWQKLGYPFITLTPSYATALGSSGDRPAALATLMGILLSDGMRMPTLGIDDLRFAVGTPYETHFGVVPADAHRVLPIEVARTARKMLALVVAGGTGKRLDGVFTTDDGQPLVVGAKTGTGDHRFETWGKGGVLLSSRVVSRSGTVVFYIGNRHFGTLTAYVKGPEAAGYQFTSALPAQILKTLAPVLREAINRAPRMGISCAVDGALRPWPLQEPEPAISAPTAAASEVLDTVRSVPGGQAEPADPEPGAGSAAEVIE